MNNIVLNSYMNWLDSLNNSRQLRNKINNSECLHDKCTECKGSGKKKNGQMCIHMISCPCSKCSPTY